MSTETLENILLEKLRPLIRQIIKEELEASSKEDRPKSTLLSNTETKELSQSLEDKLQKVADFIISHRKELGF
jgi:rRNA-processing protein FCF1